MKKVLVVASLGLLVTALSCGGGDDNSGIDASTPEGQGKAGIIYSCASSNLDLSAMAGSINENETIPAEETACNSGKVVTSGSINAGETSGTVTINSEFEECSLTDDVCMTGEEVIINGNLKAVGDVAVSGETASVDITIDGTLKTTGMFIASCSIDINANVPDVEAINGPEDIEFSGTICGVDFADLWDITETELDTLCAAVIAGGDAELASL